MSETRIELISPELRKRLDFASETQLRRIAAVVSRTIVERVGISHPVVTRALEELDTLKPPVGDLRAEVQTLADEMDSAYLDLSEECEAGRANREQVTVAFSKARAVAAITFALAHNSVVAASEATYEAALAVDDAAAITSIAEKILNHDQAA